VGGGSNSPNGDGKARASAADRRMGAAMGPVSPGLPTIGLMDKPRSASSALDQGEMHCTDSGMGAGGGAKLFAPAALEKHPLQCRRVRRMPSLPSCHS